jgi:thiamine biosynthesis lipoprotein
VRAFERRIDCFGGRAGVAVLSDDPRAAGGALDEAERRLREWHDRLTRFEPGSELRRLNDDPRRRVPASDVMLTFAAAVPVAGDLSGGLVDATLLRPLEQAGYDRSLEGRMVEGDGEPSDLRPGRPARPSDLRRWRNVSADPATRRVERPPGVVLDSGGLAKGLAADDVADAFAGFSRFTVDCAGDLRLGGRDPRRWRVGVSAPDGGPAVAALDVPNGHAVATSGTTRRGWRHDGEWRHHILDPATGLPAYTGVVQATALAPSCFEAEVLAKTALLAGPTEGPQHLVHGGVLVLAGGRAVELLARDQRGAAA